MNKKKTYMVIYDYGQGGIWFLMDAYSKEDVEKIRPEFVVYDDENKPSWMTPEKKQEFIAHCEKSAFHWDIDKEFTGWLAECLLQPLPKGASAHEMIRAVLNLNGNNISEITQKMGVSQEYILNVVRGKIQPTREEIEAIRTLIKQYANASKVPGSQGIS